MYASQVFAFLLVAAAALTEARAIEPRQIGNLSCNLARLKIVGAISSTKNSVGDIQDPAVKDAAAAGLKQANDGISNIASALLTGEKAAAEDRDAVAAGLQATDTALQGGDQTDDAVKKAGDSLQKAVAAGQDVVSECK
ncbi:uncharacterized protein LY79DRAFT_206561 [Colletotrichum navitas]|uniref:Cell wall protein n=1 Tax=Colletotrichum navitas TaxID=681940 RepID=A0AAD8QCF1_9PEZI|nr:uncharacterized protein LY79DRAFT_206561 [Colletotrichum navitas]KAK1599052.1 hypothetical protein LY79DRAFT_206561 [Colletotrichum navitas]